MRQQRNEERRIALQNRWYVGGIAAVVSTTLVFSGLSPAIAEEVNPDPAATTQAADTPTETSATDASATDAADAAATDAADAAATDAADAAATDAADAAATDAADAAATDTSASDTSAADAATTPTDSPAAPDATTPQRIAPLAAPNADISPLALVCGQLNGGFEIDGNYTPGDCGGNKDWTSVAYTTTTQGGTYNTGRKDDDPTETWSEGGGTPPKVQFDRVYSFAETVGGDYLLNMAWERPSNSGTGGFAIEVTNLGIRMGNNVPQPNRSAGGYVFFFTMQGNGLPVLELTCTYTSQADYPTSGASPNCHAPVAGAFFAAASDAPLASPQGGTIPAGAFFEIGLNVTDLTGGVIQPGCPAPSAATAYLRSFTGESSGPGSNPKGWVGPLEVTPPSTCVPLTATKTATPSFVRDYDWTIEKTVDHDSAKVKPGQSATFDYTVTVTPSAPQDSGFTVTGVITVKNTNPIDVPITGVTDSIPGATCVINGSQTPVVAKNGGTANIAYTCTLPTGAAGTNTATVTWGDTAIPAGSTQATANYTFAGLAPKATTDASVTVSDTAAAFGGSKVVTKLDGPTKFQYSRSLGSELGSDVCKNYDNTASIAATSDQPKLEDSVTVQVCTGADLTIEKNVVVSLTRTYAWDIEKSVDKTVKTVDPVTGKATFDYTVLVTPGDATDSDWAMSGQITVANPNDWDVVATVTDLPSFADVSCTVTGGAGATIPANSSKVFDYDCTFPDDGLFAQGSNKAKVTWDDDAAYSPNSSVTDTVQISTADWHVSPINKTVTVVDDKTDPAHPVTLGTVDWAGGPKEFHYSITFDGTPGSCVDYTNIAKIVETGDTDDVKVTVCDYQDLTVSKTANPTFDRSYSFDIDKTAKATKLVVDPVTGKATATYTVTVTDGAASDSNFAVSGEIAVTNPNKVGVPLTTLTDKIGATSCTLDLPADLTVPAQSTILVDYTCAPSATADTSGTNTATATWDKSRLLGTSGTATGTKDFDFADAVVTDLNDKTVTVTDQFTNPAGPAVVLGEHTWTGEGEVQKWTYDRELQGTVGACVEVDNTATIVETEQSDDATVELCGYQDLTIAKTATGSFDRDYDWSITKDVNDNAITVPVGGTADFKYTVTVTPTAAQDSNFVVEGTITVNNPNSVPVTITLDDQLEGCVVTGTANLTIPAKGMREFPYTCDLDDATASSEITNTVDITWPKATLPNTSGAASTSASVDFGEVTPATTDATATVSDTAAEFGGSKVLNAADGPKSYEYTRTLGTPDGVCTEYPNTATVDPSDESSKSDSETVEVCAPTITKEIEASVQDQTDPDLWDVSYLITVTLAGGERTYDLGDEPDFAPGVEVVSGDAQRILPAPAGTVIEGIAPDGTPFVTGVAIGGEDNTTHVYRVTWHVRIPAQIPADERACEGPGTGFYNTGILTVEHIVQEDDACGPIAEKVYPTVTKTVSDISRDPDTKEWEIQYELKVTLSNDPAVNPGHLSSKYNLSDTLDYGVIDVVDASWSGQGTTDEPFDHVGDVWSAQIATGKTITAGATHTYTVTVHATLDVTDLQQNTVGCTKNGEQRGLGFFNEATLSFTEQLPPVTVEACTPPVYPTVAKTAEGTTEDPETGLQRVSYLVKVTAPAAPAEGPVTNVLYTLVEKPDALPANVELEGDWHAEAVGADTPDPTEATWDGTGTWLLKAIGAFSAQDRIDGILTHTYRIWADLRVTGVPEYPSAPAPCTTADDEGSPIWNTVSLVFGEQSQDATACDEVNYDDVSIVKTGMLQVFDGEVGEWVPFEDGDSVEPGDAFRYELTVTNNGTRDAEDVVVTDPIPERLDVTGLTLPAGWTNENDPDYVDADNTVIASIPTFAKGATATILVDVTFTATPVPPVVPGDESSQPADPLESLTNTACVAAERDQVEENNCSTVEIPVREITAIVWTKCVADAPFLGWTISKSQALIDEDIHFLWTPDTGTATTEPENVDITHAGGTATWSDEIAWPGAAFSPSGVSIDYPGWRPIELSDIVPGSSPTQYYYPGTTDIIPAADQANYIFNGLILDDSELDYAWRLGSTITFSVNPELVFSTEYPAATAGCAVARHSNVQIEKTASVEKTDPGASFTYTLAVANVSDDSAADGVVVTDAIPADLKITDVSWPGEGDATAFPSWSSCAVAGQDGSGYGGTLTCTLNGPLQPQGAEGVSVAPTITLSATVNPKSTSSSITNIGVVDYYTFGDPSDTGRDADDAIVLLSALPATGGEPSPLLAMLGLLALLAGTTMFVVTRRRRGEAKPTV
ncbi:LPXTG cell wall anchor domain-containing protein [Microbacterium sp. NPDC058389]|uniref:LPXTG cell wall anchor domain-containing protein n=1 Tax=Microbacterium sp. NPDC058389 TaxID=3346475 RepID=UPI00364D60B7